MVIRKHTWSDKQSDYYAKKLRAMLTTDQRDELAEHRRFSYYSPETGRYYCFTMAGVFTSYTTPPLFRLQDYCCIDAERGRKVELNGFTRLYLLYTMVLADEDTFLRIASHRGVVG